MRIIPCRYQGPPEYFTMWACLVSGDAVAKISTSWLQEHEQALHATCVWYVEQHGMSPHPATLIKELVDQGKVRADSIDPRILAAIAAHHSS